eukprot:366566-Chlamydomonas_euryale.AAC.21
MWSAPVVADTRRWERRRPPTLQLCPARPQGVRRSLVQLGPAGCKGCVAGSCDFVRPARRGASLARATWTGWSPGCNVAPACTELAPPARFPCRCRPQNRHPARHCLKVEHPARHCLKALSQGSLGRRSPKASGKEVLTNRPLQARFARPAKAEVQVITVCVTSRCDTQPVAGP